MRSTLRGPGQPVRGVRTMGPGSGLQGSPPTARPPGSRERGARMCPWAVASDPRPCELKTTLPAWEAGLCGVSDTCHVTRITWAHGPRGASAVTSGRRRGCRALRTSSARAAAVPNAPGGDSCWALGRSFPSYSCLLISEHDLRGAGGPAHTGVANWGCGGGERGSLLTAARPPARHRLVQARNRPRTALRKHL